MGLAVLFSPPWAMALRPVLPAGHCPVQDLVLLPAKEACCHKGCNQWTGWTEKRHRMGACPCAQKSLLLCLCYWMLCCLCNHQRVEDQKVSHVPMERCCCHVCKPKGWLCAALICCAGRRANNQRQGCGQAEGCAVCAASLGIITGSLSLPQHLRRLILHVKFETTVLVVSKFWP